MSGEARPGSRYRRLRPAWRLLVVLTLVAGILLGGVDVSAAPLDPDSAWLAKRAVVVNSVDGVNVRQRPNASSKVLLAVPDGTEVELRLDETIPVTTDDDITWWPVSVQGVKGWMSGEFLEALDGGAGPTEAATDTPDGSDTTGESGFAMGDRVEVRTDDGSGLSMRSDPSRDAERIAVLGEGDEVEIVGEAVTDEDGGVWYEVSDGSISAWVFGAYLVPADTVGGANLTPDGNFAVNLRKRANRNADVLQILPPSAVIAIAGEPVTNAAGETWYKVETPLATGFVLAELMQFTDAELTMGGTATGVFMYPVEKFTFTQEYGCTGYYLEPWSETLGCHYHNGIDLAAAAYTPIMAADGGVVSAVGWCDCGLGYFVKIDHQNGFETVYGHLASMPYVEVGQVVNKGDVIAPMGSTGNSTGPHLHFIILVNGEDVDPLLYLP